MQKLHKKCHASVAEIREKLRNENWQKSNGGLCNNFSHLKRKIENENVFL